MNTLTCHGYLSLSDWIADNVLGNLSVHDASVQYINNNNTKELINNIEYVSACHSILTEYFLIYNEKLTDSLRQMLSKQRTQHNRCHVECSRRLQRLTTHLAARWHCWVCAIFIYVYTTKSPYTCQFIFMHN